MNSEVIKSPRSGRLLRLWRWRHKSLALWMMVAAGALAWHFGPGQRWLELDEVGRYVRFAESASASEQWAGAVVQYGRAINALPADAKEQRRRLAFAQAQARIHSGDLVAGQDQLEQLIKDQGADPASDVNLSDAMRHELAISGYHAAWLMRLEGASTDEWMAEAERARQGFRLLAEETSPQGEATSDAYRKNLEATIRLQQMDLSTLQAKPLPKKCPKNCRNLCKRKRKQCQSRCQSSGDKESKGGKKKKAPQDGRRQMKKERGAGLSEVSGSGS